MENTRRIVAVALMKQEQKGYANLVLNNALSRCSCTPQEKGFVSALFYGTVERQITLDYILQKFIKQPLEKLDAPVRAVLRSGLYQTREMRGVPLAVAINESVNLVRQLGKSSAAGMVNAVLRRAAKYDLSTETFADPVEKLCVQYSTSRPIVSLLLEKIPDEAEAILAHSFTAPKLCVRTNTLKNSNEELKEIFAEKRIDVQEGTVQNSFYVQYRGDITGSKLFQKGCFHVQGEASQFACSALQAQKGQKVLDLCAAPGGKTATIAQYMQNTGTLYSCDVAENRLGLIKKLVERLDISCVTVSQQDASQYNPEFENADAVLCDVPCSGLGILSKKPDIRQKDLCELDALVALQHEILKTAARYVKQGGRLVYSTCTINPDENTGVVKAFLRNNPDFKIVLLKDAPDGATIEDGMVTLYPHNTKTDGFFVAAMERV